MLFNSFEFIFAFLPLTVLGFLILSARRMTLAVVVWLTLASLVYYGWWDWRYVGLVIATMLFNYAVGNEMRRLSAPGQRKALLAFAVGADLLLLGYFKYAMFFVDNVAWLTGSGWSIEKIVLPLGISFFTFQQIAYVVDSYRGDAPRSGLAEYMLFVTFFPHSIAGPIVHPNDTIPQFRNPDTFKPRLINFVVGISIFLIGLFKKTVIADGIAQFATPVFSAVEAGQQVGLIDGWIGALAYTFQLYFDFSGYSDMAIGLGRIFGVHFPINFFSPYKSTGIVEFWRRWHMTLSRFLRDYLYIPLGGNRGGALRRYRNVLITMLLGGLWHGAGWNFVIWGAIHGISLVINQAWRSARGPASSHFLAKAAAWLLTFLVVVVAWVFFRAESFGGAIRVLQGMIGLGGLGLKSSLYRDGGLLWQAGIGLALCFLIALLMPNTTELMRRYRPGLFVTLGVRRIRVAESANWLRRRLVWRPSMPWAFGLGAGGCAAIAAILGWQSEFLYFQF